MTEDELRAHWTVLAALILELQLRVAQLERRVAHLEAQWATAEKAAEDLRSLTVVERVH